MDEYINTVLVLTMMTGCFQIMMGVSGMGIIVSFLADSVVSGFVTGSAFLIMTSQLKHVFGLPLQNLGVWQTIVSLVDRWRQINRSTFTIFVTCLLLLHYIKKYSKKIAPKLFMPEQLVVVVLFGGLSFALDWKEQLSTDVVGEIPSGLPQLLLPEMSHSLLSILLESAVVMAIVSYMVSISIVKAFSRKFKYKVDVNQELIALGAANLLGALFQSYPCSGSLSRSAICANSGKHTQLHNFVQFGVMALVMLACTSFFRPLPYATLAAIIVLALKNMVDFGEAQRLYRTSRVEFSLWLLTFLGTLFFGVTRGIGIGFVGSMAMLLQRTSRPSWATIGRIGERVYRNVRRYPNAQQLDGILIFRWDGPLNFANKEYFIDVVAERRDRFLSTVTPQMFWVLDCACISYMDTSAVLMLETMIEVHKKQGVVLCLSTVRGPCRDTLKGTGLWDLIGQENMFPELHDAVVFCEGQCQLKALTTTTQHPPSPI